MNNKKINTGGGASTGGNVNTGGGNFTGRDTNTTVSTVISGGIIVAVIAIVALALINLLPRNVPPSVVPTVTATETPTATPTATPEPLPTATPIPGTPAEANLRNYLSAIIAKEFETVAELTSQYSLQLFNADRDKVISDLRALVSKGFTVTDYEIIGSRVIEENMTILFRVILSVDDLGKLSKTDTQIALRNENGIWRVNMNSLVDYREVPGPMVENEDLRVRVSPTKFIRFAEFTIIGFSVTTSTGQYEVLGDTDITCFVGSSVMAGDFVNSDGVFKEFFESYPTKCALPAVRAPGTFGSVKDGAKDFFNPWIPELVFEY